MTQPAATTRPVRFSHALPDGRLAGLAWPNPGKPRLVFIHANGFCASAYQAVLGRLVTEFDILAPDLRGHGTSELPADPDHHRNWNIYADDITAWLNALDRPADAFAGHSMGAIIALLSASRNAPSAPLCLVEPVVLPAPFYMVARSPFYRLLHGKVGIARAARKRFDGWDQAEDAAARYQRHPTFRNWADGVLTDYLDDGLKPAADGQFRLACAPHWEAANYEAQGHDIGAALRRHIGPVHVLGAERASTIVNRRTLTRRGIRIDTLSGTGHLAPMEAPDRVADWLAATLTTRLAGQAN
ncbi:hydrolase [Maricaulis sp. W15]|uniref:alpha/beta fold hydrolase n=1 Tax=Maricaulis sp. W15 TaxID=1772333 RepID=UPI000948CA8E|nr:alpha/beta hydrolase [Maricaulis sp. W15]OLF77861.1 hydrolase [Maricaulis sp. W15]